MRNLTNSLVLGSLLTASLSSQIHCEGFAGSSIPGAEATAGRGALARIDGLLDQGELADLFVIRVDDPATFSCTTVGGASWDTQLFLFDMDGVGISFRDDGSGTFLSTVTGQFLTGPQRLIVALTRFGTSAVDANGQHLWLQNSPLQELQPDGPGASNPMADWYHPSTLPLPAGNYELRLTGASFAYDDMDPAPGYAWAWSNVASPGGTYTPATAYQRSLSGELIKIEHLSTGSYRVDFGRLPIRPYSLQVSPFSQVGWPFPGSNANTAVIEGSGQVWAAGSTHGSLTAWVKTYDSNGSLVNSRFNVLAQVAGTNDNQRYAFCFTDQPNTTAYTPDLNYQWNGDRNPITVTRISVGRYRVSLPGLSTSGASEGGHVQVSPLAAQSVFASVESWTNAGPDIHVMVRTFDDSGAPSDERFMLSYHEEATPMASHLGSGAHVWANLATASSYVPSTFYSDSNGVAGPQSQPLITRTGVGSYEVDLPDLNPSDASIAMVTAQGTGPSYATVDGWSALAGGGTKVRVRTRDIGGAAADRRFTLFYLTDDPAGTPAVSEPFGYGCAGLGLTADSRPVLRGDWELRGFGAPSQALFGLIMVGTSNPNTPLGLLGAPGCTVYTDPMISAVVPLADPRWQLAIPDSAQLIGFPLRAQAAAVAPALNSLGIVTSNGLRGTVGGV